MIGKLSFKYLIKKNKRSLLLVLCIASVCSFVASKSLVEKNSTYVNVNIKMYKKWKIKMYNLGSTIHQLSYHQ